MGIKSSAKTSVKVASNGIERNVHQTGFAKGEKFYHQLIDSLENYAVFTTDKKGVITTWNSGAENIFGFSEEEILGKDSVILFTPEDIKLKKNLQELKTAIKMGRARDERWHMHRNGLKLWGVGLVFPLTDEKNKHIGFTKIMRNMTQRKQIEGNLLFLSEASKILSSSLEYKKTLQNVARIAVPHIADWCTVHLLSEEGVTQQVALTHADPKKIKWARSYQKLYPENNDPNSGINKVIKTAISELYPDIPDELLTATIKDPKQLDLIRKLGMKSAMMVPIKQEAGVAGVITFISAESGKHYSQADLAMAEELASRASMAITNVKLYSDAQQEIVERKKIEVQLRESEDRFRAMADKAPVLIWLASPDKSALWFNQVWLDYTGKKLKQELKRGWMKGVHKDDMEQFQNVIDKSFKERAEFSIEYRLKRADGEYRWMLENGIPRYDASDNFLGYIGSCFDINERKIMEDKKDEFIGIASHELKTPLTSIKGYTQILERIIKELGHEKATQYLNKTNIYIDKLNSLIGDLLDVSKVQAGKLQFNYEEFDFDELIEQSIESFQPITERHKIIKTGSSHHRIFADRSRIEQVVINLLSNAIKYSPNATEVKVNVHNGDGNVTVSITDHGVGIPKERQDKLFQRFYRVEDTAEQFSGLGIGLYISAEIINRHQGKIWLKSKEGKGSTFFFCLPIKSEPA